jgi:hypothetical protein
MSNIYIFRYHEEGIFCSFCLIYIFIILLILEKQDTNIMTRRRDSVTVTNFWPLRTKNV